jgi:hypothetical protein
MLKLKIQGRFWLPLLFLTLWATAAAAMPPEQEARVERLLQALSEKNGLVFIRNDREYDLSAALEHLRRKLAHGGGEIASAEEFIDKLASTSMLSGRPYQVRLPGGEVVDFGPYLHQLLRATAP